MAPKLPTKSYARITIDLKLPDLIEVQLESFERLKKKAWLISSMKYHPSNPITRG